MKKILLIEDNNDIVDLIKMIFDNQYILNAYNNIRDILKNPETLENSDLIISDFLLKDMNCENLLKKFTHKNFIVISAYNIQSHEIKNLLTYPNVKFLQKPFKVSDLILMVENELL